MRERKRRHDDAHYPQSRGKKRINLEGKIKLAKCEGCGIFWKGSTHLCDERLTKAIPKDIKQTK